ncbi:ift57 [Symbiodinium sp. KB8]|nr:ift57 [Symbiodinium sp. KB8]
MTNVLGMLSILNYEADYCEARDVAPFNAGSFATAASNPGLQLQQFVGLCSWLFELSGRNPGISEYDDPNITAQTIHLEMNSMGYEAAFPATALRAAHGEPACLTLHFLCEAALKARQFVFRRAEYALESGVEEVEADADAEVAVPGDDGIVDEVDGAVEEEEVLYSEVANRGGALGGGESKLDDSVDAEARVVMKARVAPAKWRAEVERVAPKLRVKPHMGGREWRTHLEATRKHQSVLGQVFPDTHSSLERIGAEVGSMVERVSSKERFINSTFRDLNAEYKTVQDAHDAASEKAKAAEEEVSRLTMALADVTEELEELEGQLEDRGESITDTSPLLRIKAALAKLRSEMVGMDTRVGVLGHRLMQHSMAANLARAGKTRAGGTAGGSGEASEGELEFGDEDEY